MLDLPERTDTTRVVVFAHTPVIAAGLSDLLGDTDGIGIAGSTTELATLAALIVEHEAQVVVTEVLNDSENPSQLFNTIRSTDRQVGTPAHIVCVIPSPAGLASDLKRRGATAVIAMTDHPDALRRGGAEATAPTLGPTTFRETARTPGSPTLTVRELDVLQGMVDGQSSRVIAENLGVSVNTIRTHVQRLLPKLGAHNRLRAAAVAVELGLVAPSSAGTTLRIDA